MSGWEKKPSDPEVTDGKKKVRLLEVCSMGSRRGSRRVHPWIYVRRFTRSPGVESVGVFFTSKILHG